MEQKFLSKIEMYYKMPASEDGHLIGDERDNMRKFSNTKKITISAMFLGLALVLPFLTGQIKQIGNMLCPMHIPVLLCGFLCGGPWGLVVGFVAPILRSMIFGMPMMFPSAVCMAFELGTYGIVSGSLHNAFNKKKWMVYPTLLVAMIAGRIVWGVVMLICMGFDTAKFGFSAFASGAVLTAIPGIIIQLILIPAIVMTIEKNGDSKTVSKGK